MPVSSSESTYLNKHCRIMVTMVKPVIFQGGRKRKYMLTIHMQYQLYVEVYHYNNDLNVTRLDMKLSAYLVDTCGSVTFVK